MPARKFRATSTIMKFGLHYQLACSACQSPVQRYRDTLEQAVYAEALGFESVWLGEHHFIADLSIMPAPLLLLAAVAQRTRSLRLGIAVVLLPFSHPIRIAEEIATLDVLSNGRVEFGVGRGTVPANFNGFGVPQSENRERFLEALEIIPALWQDESVWYRGRFFQAEGLAVVPKPVQRPHPPIRVAANSVDTFELMGRMGHQIFAASQINPYHRIKECLSVYWQARAAAGHPSNSADDFTLLSPVYVGQNKAQIREEIGPSVRHWLKTQRSLEAPTSIADTLRRWRWQTLTWAESRVGIVSRVLPLTVAVHLRALIDRPHQRTYERMSETRAIWDTPERCVERLTHLQEEFKIGRIICWFNPGGQVPHLQVMRSMELFAGKVMPHFQSRSESSSETDNNRSQGLGPGGLVRTLPSYFPSLAGC
jgi:alkanesulfonate monooxygenase SsuD/methylene tetrahydromethanopterin reductase-like flavin-dependent oxidoreductase (luciferase family)